MSPIHPDELGWALEEELDKDAILVSENLSGSNNFYSTGFREDEKMWLSTSGAGLGWGVGAAIGAKLGQPDRQVVCNIGDGSVMYSASGFWSQARYGVPVLTVVCNNLNYQTVRNAYVRYGGKMEQADGRELRRPQARPPPGHRCHSGGKPILAGRPGEKNRWRGRLDLAPGLQPRRKTHPRSLEK